MGLVVVGVVVSVREWTLVLPWTRPPLSLNDRMHYRAKARWTRQVRGTATLLAYQQRIPALARCSVQLVYAPRDSRRRDDDNLVGTLKPLADGLVDAGVVPDDTPAWMVKPTPLIVAPARPARLWLVVTELGPGCDIPANDIPAGVTP